MNKPLAKFFLTTSIAVSSGFAAEPLKLPVYSTFDGDADGWVSSSTAFQHFPNAGNPHGCIGLEDIGSDGNWAVAPAKFLGDWSALDEKGALFFDHKVYDPGTGNPLEKGDYIVRITGENGAQATWVKEGPEGATPWLSFRVPIRQSKWTLEDGTVWAELLANVTKLEIKMEMFGNTSGPIPLEHDKDAIDNVALAFVNQPCDLQIKMQPTLRFQTTKGLEYLIETSSDNENFKTLATITGTGNFVFYTDVRQLATRQFYRLVCPE